jgi:hypothetical protein
MVYLVLGAREAARWVVTASRGTTIAGVLVLDGESGTAAELPDGKVVEPMNPAAQDPGRMEACGGLYRTLPGTHRPGPGAMLMDRQVELLTGRRLDGWIGAHQVGRVAAQ